MDSFDSDTYHIWRSDFHEIFQEAISQKSKVTVLSHLPLDLCNSADVKLDGKILALTGLKAQFVMTGYDLNLSNNFPPSPQCQYSFAVDIASPKGGINKMEYSGRAYILDRSLQKNNLPDGLLLRISRPNRIRYARRHNRLGCPDGEMMMPGLILVDHAPTSRRALLSLLMRYYKRKNRNTPAIINISAGGVCLDTRDRGGQRLLGADEFYLFFFFAQQPQPGMTPHVFLGKKVGIFRKDRNDSPALRIKFLKEMIWNDPAEEIYWKNIEKDGSDTISVLMECWKMSGDSEEKE